MTTTKFLAALLALSFLAGCTNTGSNARSGSQAELTRNNVADEDIRRLQ